MKTFVISLLFIVVLVTVIGATSALIPKSPYLAGIVILEFGTFLYGLFRWFAHEIVYQCAQCNCYFALSPISNFMAYNAIDTRFLGCPACNTSNFDRGFYRKEIKADIIESGQTKPLKNENWTGFYIQIWMVTLLFIICFVTFIALRQGAGAYSGPDYQHAVKWIRGILLTCITIAGAYYIIYLAVFISAIRQGYKTGKHTAMTVIFSIIFFIILFNECSRYSDFAKGVKEICC